MEPNNKTTDLCDFYLYGFAVLQTQDLYRKEPLE